MTAPPEVIDLVERFERNIDAYRSGHYKEAQLREEFLNPFFGALGWDVYNKEGRAEAYKQVIHEDAISVGGRTKAPDYCFRIGGARKFFLEAKKPSIDIKGAPNPAYQLRRYAWSAKLPLSILSDFEEFAVYDCRVRPRPSDKAAAARTLYYQFGDYPEKWDEIYGVFGHEAILKGSFDKFVEKARKKRGTAEVDDAFLAEIEAWRKALAKNIAARNKKLSTRELNFAVQRIIDRLIFLRICEDRGIEHYEQLRGLLNGEKVYKRLVAVFEKADDRYNSGLFHFRQERGRAEAPDELTPNLKLDDKPLKDIVRKLYYPESPYEFSVLPADILGQVYEQFLGKVIRLTAGHHARVEEKPEVRKAGGVYYTPTYIVDYIVKNTVGKLLKGKKLLKKNGARNPLTLRVLDPACGSGSFLIGAYQYLLDAYRDAYVKDGPKKHRDVLYEAAGGEWRLATAEKKRILLAHIHGVDIDQQAVEVTKLSLLLKVLEGESEETIKTQLKMFHARALPDLSSNIKCGNSLIGPDFYDNQQMRLLDEEEKYRVNVFDWKRAFPQVFTGKNPGFDAVIGNPPYIRIQTMKEWAPVEVEFYKKAFESARKGNYDIYVVFVEKGLGLLSPNGTLGFILPHKFFNAQYGEALRSLLAKGKHLRQVVHFGAQQVFAGATTYTCLMILSRAGSERLEFTAVDDLTAWRNTRKCATATITASRATASEWNFVAGPGVAVFEKLCAMPVKLGDITDIFVGLQTSADDVFVMELVKETRDALHLMSKALGETYTLEKNLLFPLISGTDVKRYCDLPKRQYILFPYETDGPAVKLITLETIARHYPRTAAYLVKNKGRLEERERGKFRGSDWHRFGRSQNIGIQDQVKLCVPRLVERLHAAYDVEGNRYLDNVDVGGITLKSQGQQQGFLYLLGLINCKLLGWYFPFISAPFRGGWRSANRQFLSQLPIRPIDFSNKSDKSAHDEMVSLVESMLSLHKKLAAAKTSHAKEVISREIEATDQQIDRLVYSLYGLSDEEIRIVEEASRS